MTKYQKKSTTQIQREIAAKVIANMETAGTNWLRNWAVPANQQPTSMSTGKAYNGINWLILGISRMANGFQSGQWATYRQWKKLGAQVRKGSKSETVILYKPAIGKDKETGEEFSYTYMTSFNVFNADQVDGFDAATNDGPDWANADNPVTIADDIAERVGAPVRHDNLVQAFCDAGGNYINMPYVSQFDTQAGYAATLFHELIHWTGATSRLDRESFKKYAQHRAFEELTAELGAAMLAGVTGVSPEPRMDHSKYLNSWIERIKKDPKAIFKAAAQASKASTFILDGAKVQQNKVNQAA